MPLASPPHAHSESFNGDLFVLRSDELHDFIGATSFKGDTLWSGAHVYRLEYVPTREQAGGTSYGYIRWTLDGNLLVEISADALRERKGTGPPPYYDPFTVHERLISQEPMYILFNIAVSDYWHQKIPGMEPQFPATFEIDYVRVYQEFGNNETTSCDPVSHPTAKYIRENADIYDGRCAASPIVSTMGVTDPHPVFVSPVQYHNPYICEFV